jgi:hypothetical protein
MSHSLQVLERPVELGRMKIMGIQEKNMRIQEDGRP